MPDCASAILRVQAKDAEVLKALCIENDDMDIELSVAEGEWIENDLIAQIELYDCPWGGSYFMVFGSQLQKLGVAYRIIDGGHYTWSPYEVGWEPGMEEAVERAVNFDGHPELPKWKFEEVLDRVQGDTNLLTTWIQGYFSDSPHRWLV